MTRMKEQLYLICKTQSTCKKLRLNLIDNWDVVFLPTVNLQIKTLFKGKGVLITEELLHLCKLFVQLRLYISGKNIACGSHHYSTLFFAKIMAFLGIKHRVYLFNFYIHGLGDKKFIQRILQFLLGQNAGIMTQSKTEIGYYKKLNPLIDISFFPYCSNEITGYTRPKVNENQYLFTGGYTNRDYQLLFECAAQLPHEQFIIVCSHLNTLPSRIPANVTIFRDLNSSEFHSLMAGSKAVVLPLKDDVGASGQMVALAGMQMEKTVVYPNFDVVSQYFDDKVNGLMYQAGEQDSMIKALGFVTDNPDLLHTIGRKARQKWDSSYRRENFISAVCEHLTVFFDRESS